MGNINAKGNLREATIAAVVIRADGTREDLGVISRWHKNPMIRLRWRVADLLKRR